MEFLAKHGPNTSCAEGHNLILSQAGRLGKTDHALVWNGMNIEEGSMITDILIRILSKSILFQMNFQVSLMAEQKLQSKFSSTMNLWKRK